MRALPRATYAATNGGVHAHVVPCHRPIDLPESLPIMANKSILSPPTPLCRLPYPELSAPRDPPGRGYSEPICRISMANVSDSLLYSRKPIRTPLSDEPKPESSTSEDNHVVSYRVSQMLRLDQR